MRHREKSIQKSARLRSVPRHGVSKQAVMSQLSLFNHVLRYRTVSKHYLREIFPFSGISSFVIIVMRISAVNTLYFAFLMISVSLAKLSRS